MKKKMVQLLCTVFAVAGIFAGGSKESGKQVLNVAGLKGAYGDVYWQELKKGFEAANPGVEVKLTIEAHVEATINPQIMAGAGPDVIYLGTGRPAQLTEMMISSRAVRDLTGLLEKNVYNENIKLKDRILSSIMGNGITNPYANDNKHYMLPLFFASNGLFFNADLFYANDGDGVEGPKKNGRYELPATWDEFLALGELLNQERKNNPATPYLFTYPTAGYLDTMVPASIAASAGEQVVKQAFNYEPVWENANVKAVFKNLGKIRPYILPTTVGNANVNGFKDNQQAVIDGRALFMTNGDWVKGEMADTTPAGFNWGSSPFLAFSKNGTRYGTVFAEQIYISNNTKVSELAEKFILYVYSNEGLATMSPFVNTAFYKRSVGNLLCLCR